MKRQLLVTFAGLALPCAALMGACTIESPPWYPGICLARDPPPVYLWIGPSDELPSCAAHGATVVFKAHADPVPEPLTCPLCSCGESKTACPPPDEWAVAPRSCAEPAGDDEVFFGGPSGWNGVCSTQTKIAADIQCAGGEPCAQSLTVAAPAASGGPCVSSTRGDPTRADPPWSWATTVIGCVDSTPEYCDDDRYIHIATDPDSFLSSGPDGFVLCVEQQGATCPRGFDEKVTVYLDAEDSRECTPCSCGAPEGNACSFDVSAYSDEACVTAAGAAFVSSSDEDVCFDVPDGTALGSKKAELVAATPGTCAPGGGEPTGEVLPTSPVVFCCSP